MMQTPRDYQSRWRAFISEGGTQAREEPRPHRRPLEWTHAGIVGVLAARSAARPRGQELIEKLTLGAARLSVQLLDGSSETTTRPRLTGSALTRKAIYVCTHIRARSASGLLMASRGGIF